MTYPNHEEIKKKLTEKFSKEMKEMLELLSEDEISNLARRVEEGFKEIESNPKPSQILRNPPEELTIHFERNESENVLPSQEDMEKCNIKLYELAYKNVIIYMVVDWEFRRVAMYCPYSKEELLELETERERLMRDFFEKWKSSNKI